jgi:hypothetical protein
MKRREIVVEQAEPWGPIVARLHDPPSAPVGSRRPGRRGDPLDESLESFA